MSYSFAVRGKNKADLLAAAAAEFNKVVESQPVHRQDEEAARQCRENVVAALPLEAPTEGKDFYQSCSGSLAWEGSYPDSYKIVGVSVNAHVSLVVE